MQSTIFFSNMIEFLFFTITFLVVTRLVIYLLHRIWRKSKCKLVWMPIDYVERRSNLSCDEFVQEYVSVGKPVIITDAMKNLKISTKWNFDFFKSECGSVRVKVKQDNADTKCFMTFADYMDYMTAGESDQRLYIANWFISDHPELLKDYTDPIYFPNWLQRLPRKLLRKYELENPELFIGHKDTSVGLHKDPNNGCAWLGMITGRKRIILFTPNQEEFLYDGKLDVFNPDFEKYPLYTKANPVEVVLEAGEVLYIPPNWWHHVKNLEDSIAVGALLLNEWNSELFFQSFTKNSPIKGHLLPLFLEFPWLGRALFAIGVI